jgi:hypothetical protein
VRCISGLAAVGHSGARCPREINNALHVQEIIEQPCSLGARGAARVLGSEDVNDRARGVPSRSIAAGETGDAM